MIERPTPESSESIAVKQKCLHWQQSCGAQITSRFAFPTFEGQAEMPALELSESTAMRLLVKRTERKATRKRRGETKSNRKTQCEREKAPKSERT